MILMEAPAWRDPAWVTSVSTLLATLGAAWGGWHMGHHGARGATAAHAETLAKLEETRAVAEATQEQVTNHHDTNLRDDITEIRDAVSHLTDVVREDQLARAAREDAIRASLDTINSRADRTHDAIFSRLHALESGRCQGRAAREEASCLTIEAG